MNGTRVDELRGHLGDWRYRELSPDARRELRERKLRAVIREAARHVPLYRERLRAAGLAPADIASLDDLARLPLIRRADLATVPTGDRLSQRAARAELRTETSSGSTGQPLTVHLDRRARRSRDLRFLRALRAVGYRPGLRVLLITDRPGAAWRRPLGWTSCPVDAAPASLASALFEARPHFLYGCTTPLRLLAEHLLERGWAGGSCPQQSETARRHHRRAPLERGRRAPLPRAVLTTAEMLDRTTRRLLAKAFGCPVYDFYGLSEVGLVAAETPKSAGYQIAEEGVHVELLPSPDSPGLARIVVTDLEALAMPFIRYDTGDLAVLDDTGAIVRIEGRSIDCLRSIDGRRVSPYAVTCALERVPGLRRYNVTQKERDAVHVRADVGDAAPDVVSRNVEAVLSTVLGAGVRIGFELLPSALPARDACPRIVECHINGSAATVGE